MARLISLNEYIARNYITIVKKQDKKYIAFHPELPNSISQGDTSEEAEENLVEVTELTLAHLKANNLPIPKPIYLNDFEFFYG